MYHKEGDHFFNDADSEFFPKRGHAYSEDHILIKDFPRLNEIVQFPNNDSERKFPNMAEVKQARKPSFKLIDEDSEKFYRLEKLKFQNTSCPYKITVNGCLLDTPDKINDNYQDARKRSRILSTNH